MEEGVLVAPEPAVLFVDTEEALCSGPVGYGDNFS